MSQPKKIVHILGAMDIGGVETWLMSILKTANAKDFKHELIVHRDKHAYFDNEIAELGVKKYICKPDNILKYMYDLFFLFKKIKPDVVHSHVHAFSGVIMFVSWLAGVKTRISHSHSDTRLIESNIKNIRNTYLEFMKLLITRFATSNIAVSEKAAISLFGKKWSQNSKNKIIYCGVDYNKFKNIKNSIDYHEMLNIPKDSIVIGHVGRFEEPKNHKFILDVFSKLSSLDSKYYLVLVGDGSLKVDIESIANQSNVSSRIKFMGNRSDIPGIMSGLFDVFVFPSLWEGLPLTLVEAQFANLLCIVSNNVTKECNLGLCKYLNINETSNWVTCLSDLPNVETEQSFELSEFNIERSNTHLFKEYLKNDY